MDFSSDSDNSPGSGPAHGDTGTQDNVGGGSARCEARHTVTEMAEQPRSCDVATVETVENVDSVGRDLIYYIVE